MKIVHFSWEFPPAIWGGLGTFAMELSHRQVSLGNKVTVFALNNENKLALSENWKGVRIYRPPLLNLEPLYIFANEDLRCWGKNFKFFADVLSYNLTSSFQLLEKEIEYDIVHAHDWLGILAGMISKKGKSLFFHVHSTEPGRSGNGSQTIKSIELQGGESADCVITVSYAMQEELIRMGFPKHKIRVSWNGVDPYKYDPTKVSTTEKRLLRKRYGIGDREILLFFIGRLVNFKGVINLIKAMPSILQDFQAKLLILGVGDLAQEIRVLLKELNLSKKVIMRNEFVREEERILHYAISDVVVLPSFYEPFGIVCSEAMAMSKPVVVGARGTSGLREQVISGGDKQCGVHINPFDPEDIAWGVKKVLECKERATQMGKNGRERVLKEFNWDAVTKRILHIYKEFER
jgi:glycosyltransferase involved in cell wall biosynthesis